MKLDDVLNAKPTSKAPPMLDLINNVRDTGAAAGALSSVRLSPPETDFFGAGEEQLTFDLTPESPKAFDISAPIVPTEDPFANTLSTGPFDVAGPAAQLLDTFSPDINTLSRTGLPLTGVDIPDEQAIRDLLRKILRRL